MKNREEWHPCRCGNVRDVENRAERVMMDMAMAGECPVYMLAVAVAMVRMTSVQMNLMQEQYRAHGEVENSIDTARQVADTIEVLGRLNEAGDRIRGIEIFNNMVAIHRAEGGEDPLTS